MYRIKSAVIKKDSGENGLDRREKKEDEKGQRREGKRQIGKKHEPPELSLIVQGTISSRIDRAGITTPKIYGFIMVLPRQFYKVALDF